MPSSHKLEDLNTQIQSEAQRYCAWLTKSAKSNFALSFNLLPKSGKQAMEVVYAFCRAVDDATDREGITPEEARAQVDAWLQELSALEAGVPAHPITVALKPVLKTYQIPMAPLVKLVRGVEMDIDPPKLQTFEDLRVYCEHVASAVGEMCIRVFGCQHPEAVTYANRLGVALQLTNILRDLKSDAQMGRIYLPREELKQFGYSEDALLAGEQSPAFVELMQFQVQRAWDYYAQAKTALLESGEGRKLLPARIMAGVYAQILKQIEMRHYDVFTDRVSVPKPRQMMIAAKCLITSSS